MAGGEGFPAWAGTAGGLGTAAAGGISSGMLGGSWLIRDMSSTPSVLPSRLQSSPIAGGRTEPLISVGYPRSWLRRLP